MVAMISEAFVQLFLMKASTGNGTSTCSHRCFKWSNLLNLSAVSQLLLLLTFLYQQSMKSSAKDQGSLMLGAVQKDSCVPHMKRDNRWIGTESKVVVTGY